MFLISKPFKLLVLSLSVAVLSFSCDPVNDTNAEVLAFYPIIDAYPVDHVDPIDHSVNLPLLPNNPIFYNAGIVSHQGRYLMAIRTESFVDDWREKSFSRVTLAFLRKDLSGYDEFKELNITYNGQQLDVEDPRLFVFRSEVYVLFNMSIPGDSRTETQMYFAKLDLSNGLPNSIEYKHIKYDKHRTEKNWTPFEYNQELYFISNHSTQTVFKVDHETGTAVKQSSCEKVLWPHGQIRGGTPTITLNEDEYLTFFHSSKPYAFASGDSKRVYFAGALTFSRKPPFRILRMTKKPIMDSDFYDDSNNNMIVFPTGILQEGNQVSMLFGKNDNHLVLSKMSLEKLDHVLEPL